MARSSVIRSRKLKVLGVGPGKFSSSFLSGKKNIRSNKEGKHIIVGEVTKLIGDNNQLKNAGKKLPGCSRDGSGATKLAANAISKIIGQKIKNQAINIMKNVKISSKKTRPTTGQSVSTLHTNKLAKDGRRTPEQFRMNVLAVSSPSQISLKSLTEHYKIPDSKFETAEDVFSYRGYKKLAKIDEGAFGIVSKALRTSDNLIVAVKEIDLSKKKSKRIEEMRRELFVLQKVDHSNVVKLIEHFIVDQTLVIIMEFCAGNNLTSYLKECAIDESEAKNLFRQMALSIKILHKKGISHRDVKLNNFLLDGKKKLVKVGDFGLSVVSFRQSSGVMMAKTYCGTEPYMAPEILKRNSQGVRSYNPLHADVWSLGVCLFAMLTRTFPFKMHTSQRGLIRAQTSRKWKFPRSLRDILSDELKDLVWHMLDPEPERRITINGVVAHPWLNGNRLFELSYDESVNNTPTQTPSLIDATPS